MSKKGLSGYVVQLVNRDDVESHGQLIESNIESLDGRNRIEQRDKSKWSRAAYIAHLTKQLKPLAI